MTCAWCGASDPVAQVALLHEGVDPDVATADDEDGRVYACESCARRIRLGPRNTGIIVDAATARSLPPDHPVMRDAR